MLHVSIIYLQFYLFIIYLLIQSTLHEKKYIT